ncbi:hypothetical protein LVJ94_14585 [Pendulispora rubella]|uniref:Lipoprotein n=1 Tax=Pendulispora rubella TaxID=2741070 RepID=A0ABZ2LFX3_9BACT
MHTMLKSAAIALGLVLAACSSSDDDKSDGSGRVSFTTWGEDYIEKEIPQADVTDGWTIHYNEFLVTIRNIKVADGAGAVGAEMKESKLFDMTTAGVKSVVTFANVAAKAWEHVSYEIAPATADTLIGAGTDADKQLMVQGGYSIYVDAVATKGAVTKKYTWGFKTVTLYDRCKGELSGKDTDGVVVTNGGTDEPQLTIHGDHLYYDDLQAKEAKVRFGNIADADKDNDGTITLDELSKVKLAAIPKENGPYGTGSAAGINDLGAFVTGLSRTIGHFRGEGECFSSAK